MKKSLLIFLVLVAAGCAGNPKILNKFPVPTDRPLYGVTPEGVFYVHESLVKNAQGEEPIFASDITYFKGRRTHLKNGYYYYDSNVSGSDKGQFNLFMKRKLMPTYLFAIGGGRHIPRALMETGWIVPKDAVENNKVGKVFSTWPVENPYLGSGK